MRLLISYSSRFVKEIGKIRNVKLYLTTTNKKFISTSLLHQSPEIPLFTAIPTTSLLHQKILFTFTTQN